MTGLLADHNVEGHVDRMIAVLHAAGYGQIWGQMKLAVESCRSLGIPETTDDRTLWNLCQLRGFSLITANRNHEDETSLEAAIRDGRSTDLPVYTFGDPQRILQDSEYALAAAVSLFEYILDLESVLGTGRLYLPKNPV